MENREMEVEEVDGQVSGDQEAAGEPCCSFRYEPQPPSPCLIYDSNSVTGGFDP